MSHKPTGPELLEIARGLRPRIELERDHIEAARRLPESLTRDLSRAGFFRIFVPEAYGGLDLTPMEGIAVFEELAQADASVAWCAWNGNTHWIINRLAPEAARTIHADTEVVTANSTRPSGRAEAATGGYRVSGRWSLVSGCELATWMVLLCVVHEEGKPRHTSAGASEMRFMVLPATACEIIDTWSVGGLRGTGSHDVVVHEAFVPNAFSAGFSDPYVLLEPRYQIPPPSRVGPGLGAMALGVARAALETFKQVAGANVPQQSAGAKAPERASQMLRDNPGAQTRVSQAEALVRASRLFLFDSLDRLWSMLIATGEVTTEGRAILRLAASYAVSSSVQAVDLLYVGAGATSLYTSCPLERAFRDVHAMTLHVGVHPRVMETAGRVLLGLEPDTSLF